MGDLRRVLVTGSRDWPAPEVVHGALQKVYDGLAPDEAMVVVHGACRTGADAQADVWLSEAMAADPRRVHAERHPADWRRYGRRAGPLRNEGMVKAGAQVCLAFIADRSRGASGMLAMAQMAGIPHMVWRRDTTM